MPTAVNWITGEITIDRADMPIIQASPEVRQLDVSAFRLDLKDLEATELGMPWPRTHNNQSPTTLSGQDYARLVEVIAPYFITFEDGQYAVSLFGANNNVVDVKTQNQVSVVANNSAGLINIQKVDDIHGQVQREIWVDTSSVQNGNGYQQTPFNNVQDALDYTEIGEFGPPRGLVFVADATLDRAVTGFQIRGVGNPVVNLNNQDVSNSEFRGVTLAGTQGAGSNGIRAFDCSLADLLAGMRGEYFDCGLLGGVSLASGATVILRQCYSELGGPAARPSVTCFGAVDFSVRGWRGGFDLLGVNDPGADVTIEADQCKVTLGATCTAGDISVRGQFQLTDSSLGSVVDLTSHVDPIVMKNTLGATLGLYGK